MRGGKSNCNFQLLLLFFPLANYIYIYVYVIINQNLNADLPHARVVSLKTVSSSVLAFLFVIEEIRITFDCAFCISFYKNISNFMIV